jgi:hypothetical protein
VLLLLLPPLLLLLLPSFLEPSSTFELVMAADSELLPLEIMTSTIE